MAESDKAAKKEAKKEEPQSIEERFRVISKHLRDVSTAVLHLGKYLNKRLGQVEKEASVGAEEARNGPRGKRQKRPRDPNRPKRPPSAYLLYCAERRKEMDSAGRPQKHIMQQLAQEWNALNERTKQPFEEEAKKEREIWLEKMKKYNRGELTNGTAPAAGSGGGAASSTAEAPPAKRARLDSQASAAPSEAPGGGSDASGDKGSESEGDSIVKKEPASTRPVVKKEKKEKHHRKSSTHRSPSHSQRSRSRSPSKRSSKKKKRVKREKEA